MRKLKDTKFAPPTGWVYEEPSTGKVFSNIVKTVLINDVTNYRIDRGIPVGDVAQDIEEFICAKASVKYPGICQEVIPPAQVTKKSFDVDDVRSFGNSVAHILKSGSVVSQGEANRRATICAGCPLNGKVSGCTGCSQIASFVLTILGAKKTPHDKYLMQCKNCGCALAAKIWITKSDLMERQEVEANMATYPDHCWMKQEPQA